MIRALYRDLFARHAPPTQKLGCISQLTNLGTGTLAAAALYGFWIITP